MIAVPPKYTRDGSSILSPQGELVLHVLEGNDGNAKIARPDNDYLSGLSFRTGPPEPHEPLEPDIALRTQGIVDSLTNGLDSSVMFTPTEAGAAFEGLAHAHRNAGNEAAADHLARCADGHANGTYVPIVTDESPER